MKTGTLDIDRRRVSYVIGNWKMQGSRQHVFDFFNELANFDNNEWKAVVRAVLCPSFPYLVDVAHAAHAMDGVWLGAQDVSQFNNGAYTGQVSAAMLLENQCRYVIVGHSERRQYCGETDEVVSTKFMVAKAAGLVPILCVGETLEQREANKTESVIVTQIQTLLEQGVDVFSGAILAYEPVWAIGTGRTATPEQAQAVHHLLRTTLAEYDATLAERLPILYGGSVKPGNAEALFKMQDIDGALVGGASLLASDFVALCRAGAKCMGSC